MVVGGPELVAHFIDGDAARPVLVVADLLPAGDVLAVSEDPDHGKGVAVGEEPVAGLDIGVRCCQEFSGCEPVERQLEVLAVGIG